MGIVNLTPDSFFDGARHNLPKQAAWHAARLREAGADILDIGAESTRPGACAISEAEELERLSPCLEEIRNLCPDVQLSVDTRKAKVAQRAIELGCSIINDVSACSYDQKLLEVIVEFKPGYVLMHSQGDPETMQIRPHYENVVDEVKYFFEEKLSLLTKSGLPENHIALDVGVGFGKSLDHNLALLRNINVFLQFGRPLLAGISMKGMFGKLLGIPKDKRESITATASALLFSKGVIWHRVHEVCAARQALALAQVLQ